jgi:N-acyl-D-amino-acid deacylase
MYDLKITHGLLVDGTGAAPREGAVAIKDGVIVAVGECDGPRGGRWTPRAGW